MTFYGALETKLIFYTEHKKFDTYFFNKRAKCKIYYSLIGGNIFNATISRFENLRKTSLLDMYQIHWLIYWLFACICSEILRILPIGCTHKICLLKVDDLISREISIIYMFFIYESFINLILLMNKITLNLLFYENI